MSDGGGESGSKHQQPHTKRKFSGDDFSQAIAKVAVAQICERVGFQTFQQSALGKLADIAVRYINSVGKAANFYANLSGRAEGIVRELIQYANEATDVPFAYAIPHFPVVKDRKPKSSFLQIGEEPPIEDIPAWLPAFPDPQTYFESPSQNERASDSYTEKIELGKQQRKMEMSMVNLQRQFSESGPSSFVHGDSSKEKKTVESNPFLSAPLHFEEKEVSSVVLPAKLSKEVALQNPVAKKHVVDNHISVMETFAPALEAMKNRFCESTEEQKNIQLDQRPPVQFKIGVGKKSLVKPLKSSPQNMDGGKIDPWFCKENENDERKGDLKIF
ncbi:BTP domain-containing protein [Citrus sinensis]|uniref:BTP domain-containing protein n=1 Tax=Citrus sinensis TaxID=2711 RepID=A0ACB8K6N0_CITSI|nr:BTP domain-containing protein [Citrus sinensis]